MADRKHMSSPGDQNPESFDMFSETDLDMGANGLRNPPKLQPGDESAAQNQLTIEKQNINTPGNPDLENLAKGDLSSDDITTVKTARKDDGEEFQNDEGEIAVQQELRRQREKQMQRMASLALEKESDDVSGLLLSGSMRILKKIPGVGFLLSMFQGSSDITQKISIIEKLIFMLKLAKPAAAVFDLERTVIMWTVPLFIPTIGLILIVSIPAAILAIPFGLLLQEHGPCPTAKAIGGVLKQFGKILEGLKKKFEVQEAKKFLIYNLKAMQLNAANEPPEGAAQKID